MSGADFPYEKQEDNYKCGAASLGMVYRSFGQSWTQAEIWPGIQRHGRVGAWTYRLACDAQQRGFAALVLQAREPWVLLDRCLKHGLRVIVNQQLRRGSGQRHFTVVTELGDEWVTYHDPFLGPAQQKDRAAFLDLWGPGYGHSAGHVLVAIDLSPKAAPACRKCRKRIPASARCPGCGRDVPLAPALALGCGRWWCDAATWNHIYCPECDKYLIPVEPDAPGESVAPEERNELMSPGNDLGKFSQVFVEYQARVQAALQQAPPSAAREQLAPMLESLSTQHAQFVEAIQKQNALLDEQIKASQDRLKAAEQKAAEKAAARAQAKPKVEKPAKKQPPPIDPELGAKLRSKLLEEFGNRPEPGRTDGNLWDWVAERKPEAGGGKP